MSSQDYKIQVSVKTPYGSLINLPVDNHEEALAGLNFIREIAGELVGTEQILQAAHAASGLLAPPLQNVAPVIPLPNAATEPVVQPDGAGQPPAFVPPVANATAPGCPHGPRVRRTGVSERGTWGAWMCPTPKGTPGQCPPIWDPKN